MKYPNEIQKLIDGDHHLPGKFHDRDDFILWTWIDYEDTPVEYMSDRQHCAYLDMKYSLEKELSDDWVVELDGYFDDQISAEIKRVV